MQCAVLCASPSTESSIQLWIDPRGPRPTPTSGSWPRIGGPWLWTTKERREVDQQLGPSTTYPRSWISTRATTSCLYCRVGSPSPSASSLPLSLPLPVPVPVPVSLHLPLPPPLPLPLPLPPYMSPKNRRSKHSARDNYCLLNVFTAFLPKWRREPVASGSRRSGMGTPLPSSGLHLSM